MFTDFDLDGISCGIIAKYIWDENVDIVYCDGHDPNSYLKEFIKNKEYDNYDKIYITDLSTNEEISKMIDELFSQKVKLYDHHESALWLNVYDWAFVHFNKNELKNKPCGVSMFHTNVGVNHYKEKDEITLCRFVEYVRKYDTWEWVSVDNGVIQAPKNICDLSMMLDREDFIKLILNNIKYNNPIIDKTSQLFIDGKTSQLKKYINIQNSKIKKLNFMDFNIGIIYSERYEFVSIVGNELCKLNPDIDFCMIINTTGVVNLRCIKDSVNVGKFAEKFGGGGHPKAAGFKYDTSILDGVFTNILNENGENLWKI